MPRVFLLGRRPKPSLLFLIAEKDPAGRTLQAAPCRPHPAGGLCKKASTPSRRPQDKPILSRAFYNLSFLGRRPKPALLFLIAEKEGKKASPLGTYKTYFEPGVL